MTIVADCRPAAKPPDTSVGHWVLVQAVAFSAMVHRIALIRHGESLWNLENIFTGWTDVDLSETGKKEAIQASLPAKVLQPGCHACQIK